MVEALEKENSLRELLINSNHPILDIRCRSIESIVFKLSNELLDAADLTNERDFLAHLLEWFNFEEWALEGQVLMLLSQLSGHAMAAKTLIDLGGVEFLSQLRLHCDSALHPLVDETLEHLLQFFHCPFLPTSTPPSISHITTSTITTTGASHQDTSVSGSRTTPTTCSELTSDISHCNISSSYHFGLQDNATQMTLTNQTLPYHLQLATPSSDLSSSVPVPLRNDHLNGASDRVLSWTPLVPNGTRWNSESTKAISSPYPVSPRLSARGRGSGGRESESVGGEGLEDDDGAAGYFPWLTLTANDHHILITTQGRLDCPSAESLCHSCDFLQDVLFQDFPPELFLQRPVLVNSLLQLLASADWSSAHSPCLSCLLILSRKMASKIRLACCQSSDTLEHPSSIAYQCVTSCDRRPCPQGDACRREEDMEQHSKEELRVLQSNQLSVSLFCSSLISAIAPLVLDHLNRDFPWLTSTNKPTPPLAGSVTLVHNCLLLLESAVEILELEWGARTEHVQSLECTEHVQAPGGCDLEEGSNSKSLRHCVGALCAAISPCQSKWRTMTSKKACLPQAQLVCCVTLNLFRQLSILLRLGGRGFWLQGEPQYPVVPALHGVLQDFIADGAMGVACPEMRDGLHDVLREMESTTTAVFNRVMVLSEAFDLKSNFLAASPEATPTDKLLELATGALPGQWFFCDAVFVRRAMVLGLDCVCGCEVGSEEWSGGKELVMRLLCHEEPRTQEQAFTHLTGFVSDSLSLSASPLNSSVMDSTDPMLVTTSVSHTSSTQPSSESVLGLSTKSPSELSCTAALKRSEMVLLDPDLLGALVTRGAMVRSEVVSSLCLELLGDAISLREELYWPELRAALLPHLPYIEVGVVENERLFQEFKLLCLSDQLPPMAKLRTLLRLLYSDSDQVRAWACSCLSQLLPVNELDKDGEDNAAPLKRCVLPHDVLVTGGRGGAGGGVARTGGIGTRRDGEFKHEDVLGLVTILKSDSVEASLKKTALQHLVLILQDRCLHKRALGEGLLSDLLELLRSIPLNHMWQLLHSGPHLQGGCVQKEVCLLKPCLDCLHVLGSCSSEVREVLADDHDALVAIFQAAVCHTEDAAVNSAASRLLALALFVKEVRVDEGCKVLLPTPLKERLKFPVEVDTYELENNHATPSPLDPHCYSSEPLLGMLRMQYLYSSAGSVEGILEDDERGTGDEKQQLKLTEGEITSLRCLALCKSLLGDLDLLTSATSHGGVVEVLQHVLVMAYTLRCLSGKEERPLYLEAVRRQWTNVMKRFLTVCPSTYQDHTLLISIISFLTDLLSLERSTFNSSSRGLVTHNELAWLAEVSLGARCVPMTLLLSSLSGQMEDDHTSLMTHSRRSLQKSLLLFYAHLLGQLSLAPPPCLVEKFDPAPLLMTLGRCLDVAGSPGYYDIPLLERSLQCLLHLTDRTLLARASSGLLGLAMQLMSSLRQVLWSFVSGHGQMGRSFMGKGVVYHASLIMAHLTHFISTQLHCPAEWWSQWLQSSDVGLTWLQRLIEDRTPQVRYAGFSLLSSLISRSSVAPLLVAMWSTVDPFGLWGICFRTGLEVRESSLVRKQALLVLVALSKVCVEEKLWDQYLVCSTSEVTARGKEALKLLLDSHQFSSVMAHAMQVDALQRLTLPLCKAVRRLVGDEHTLSFLVHAGRYPVSCVEDEMEEESDDGDGSVRLKALIGDVLVCCDPHVVSSACCFIHNVFLAYPDYLAAYLHHTAILVQLTRLLDSIVMGAFLLAGSRGIASALTQSHWTRMCIKILQLLQVVLVTRSDADLVMGGAVIEGLARVVAQCQVFMETTGALLPLASAVVSFLWALVGVLSLSEGQERVFSSIQFHWSSFTGLLLHSLQPSLSPLTLRTDSLHLLHAILVQRFRAHSSRDPRRCRPGFDPSFESSRTALAKRLLHLLDGDGKMKPACCSGGLLCAALIKARDCESFHVSSEDGGRGEEACQQRRLVHDTLSVLLACSHSAKQVALNGGLLELSLDQLKVGHAKLCAESLEQPMTVKRKMESPAASELVTVLSLLRNFMYKSQAIKTSCLRGQLPAVLHKLWPSCTVHRPLLLAAVDLLTVYTSQHQQGRMSLACSSRGSPALLQDVLKHTSHSLSGYHSCVSAKLTNPHTEVLGSLFSLLTNCSLSQEVRALMKKSSFVSGFAQVQLKSERVGTGSPQGTRLSSMWVRLLLNLSFSTDGLTLITKTTGVIEALLDVHGCGQLESQTLCLLIFRNLAFHGPSRTLLSTDERFVNVLIAALESSQLLRVTFAASAFWTLLYHSTKMRSSLRKSGLFEKMLSVSTKLKLLHSSLGLGRGKCEVWCAEALEQAMQLL